MMFKAVILDLDGTMVDTETIYSKAFVKLLHTHGATSRPYKHGLIHLVGVNTEDILQFLMKRYGIKGNTKIMVSELRGNYTHLIQNEKIKPMKGLKKLLLLLKKNHLKLAVASGSSSKIINTILAKLDIKDFFNVTIGADEVEHGKPHPDIYDTVVKRLNVNKSSCVVVEDTESGIQAAKSAGLKVVAIPNKFTKDHNFSKADTIVESLSDITIPLLQNL